MLHFFLNYPETYKEINFNSCLGIIFLAILANICFCIAYPLDLFLQRSELEKFIKFGRYAILFTGIILASILTHFSAISIFGFKF